MSIQLNDTDKTDSGLDSERVIHSMKTAIACLLGFGITKLTALDLGQWLIITIIVVMCAQINVGSVMNKASMRFLGTLSGSILAALTLALFGPDQIAVLCMIGISAAIFSYIATGTHRYNDAGTLGAVTVIIILINPHPTIYVATHRFFEISVGILIAALFSQFIFPIHARDHLRRMQAKTIKQMRDFYFTSLMTELSPHVIEHYQEIDEEIAASLSEQRKLAKQSSRETLVQEFNIHKFNELLRCEKEIFRSIISMRYACDMLPTGRHSLSNIAAVKHFHEGIYEALDQIAQAMAAQKNDNLAITIPSAPLLKEALTAVIKNLREDDVLYVNGFIFCAEILVGQLTLLVILIHKRTHGSAAS